MEQRARGFHPERDRTPRACKANGERQRVGDTEYAHFVQINTPLKLNGEVVAILMLNKFADPVAAAVRAKTLRVTALKVLTAAAAEVARGNLDVSLPAARRPTSSPRRSTK